MKQGRPRLNQPSPLGVTPIVTKTLHKNQEPTDEKLLLSQLVGAISSFPSKFFTLVLAPGLMVVLVRAEKSGDPGSGNILGIWGTF